MYEVFHFSQKINGEADRSISTELEAYVFQYSLGLKLEGTSPNTNATDKGLKLETVFNKLVLIKQIILNFSEYSEKELIYLKKVIVVEVYIVNSH
ncbi:MAG: hypothetical protein LBI73_09685 [Myroides sp.]|jgi:hypothetical protein|nr:hypothetical protein [Myroides sp.]